MVGDIESDEEDAMATVRDLMTPDPVILGAADPARHAAQRMRDEDIGDVLVEDDGVLRGIVTDRDLAVRVLAEGLDAASVTLGEVCTSDLTRVGPHDDIAEVVRLLRDRAVRRVPVVDQGAAIGVLSIGDLAVVEDPGSALADISAAPADH